ncbi:MAG TPA: FAD-dependent monooxygenase [Trebonia sp.]|jgi:2-polyprenyl-6-methoxyphenol hydroxylase-like FAD-dependent oxidoreductase
MEQRTVLVSGAGVAGPTLAYWLAGNGFRVTVAERAAGQRSSGNPVDVRGPAVDVAERMGVMPGLREAATSVSAIAFVDASGRRIGRLRTARPGSGEVEVARADLAAVLYEAARDRAEFAFGDCVTALTQDAGGVDVSFASGAARRFDLVIGADGLHSAVRRLVFGPESGFTRHLGLYVATLPLGRTADDPGTVVMYNTPGRSVSVHPANGTAMAAFIFRSPAIPGLDVHDTAAGREIVRKAYEDGGRAGGQADGWAGGWELPALLDHLAAADDLYFDSVSQVRLPAWSRGRVVLAGDAASCLSLFGGGSSLAIAGAATLAQALADAPGDHAAGFGAYERRHRARVRPAQRGRFLAGALLVPGTRATLAVRDAAVRLLGAAYAEEPSSVFSA